MEQNTILTNRGRINGYLFFGYQGGITSLHDMIPWGSERRSGVTM